ncbi:MAG: hypothetical protein RLZZ385_1033 [Pseudomonadota bacterium]|jgi:beta-lactamase class C
MPTTARLIRLVASTTLLVSLAGGIQAQEPAFAMYQGDSKGGQVLRHDFSEYMHWLQEGTEAIGLPGAAVAVVSRETVLDIETWGVRSRKTGAPLDDQSVFRIASMSKTFAGTVATLLVDRHMQSWDTPINQMFPQIHIGTTDYAGAITLKNIASHTTGLMPHAYSNMLDDGVVYEKIQEKFHEIPTVCPPGKCYGYQNVVFSLIGDVVQASTHTSYEQFLYEQLFVPLGMKGASTGLEPFEANANAAAPHRKVKSGWQVTTNNPAYYSVAPAAGINATIQDMAIWARANLGAFPEVLPAQVLQTAHSPVVETPYGNYFNRWKGMEHAYYGLGWRVFDYRGMRVIHHGGGVRGFRSEMALIPERNLGIVVLFNAETNFANDIVPAFLDSIGN